MPLFYTTAGESHGPALAGILEGMPYGVRVTESDFTSILEKRRLGYGRGPRQKIEKDSIRVLSGIYGGVTTGSPIAIIIENTEYKGNLSVLPQAMAEINVPLPGHADWPGAIKLGITNCRYIRERASARETAMRTALSVPARALLKENNIQTATFIESVGGIEAKIDYNTPIAELIEAIKLNGHDFLTPDSSVIAPWKAITDKAKKKGCGLGGVISIVISGIKAGLGSFSESKSRLDARLAGVLMGVPSVKGVEIGLASQLSHSLGRMGDAIIYKNKKRLFKTNFSGGIEGGLSTGAPIILRCHIKPLPGAIALQSVNLKTLKKAEPEPYRSDTQALSAAATAAESTAVLEIASLLIDSKL